MALKPNILAGIIDGAGNAPIVQPLRFVTSLNSYPVDSFVGTQTHRASRWAHIVGSGSIVAIKIGFINRVSGTNGTVGYGAFTLEQGSIEYNGVAAQITKDGATTANIGAGVNLTLFDEIPVSAFGVSEIPEGEKFYTKIINAVANNTIRVPSSLGRVTSTDAGQQSLIYDPAVTNMSSALLPGPFTSTGTAPAVSGGVMVPIILGRFKNSNVYVILGHGDSLKFGSGDTAYGINGIGWFQRMLRTLVNNNYTAGFNCARAGALAQLAADPNFDEFYKYCYGAALIGMGTNNFTGTGTGTTVSAMNTLMNNITTRIKNPANGFVGKIGIERLGPIASSTDNWATEANQTPNSGWEDLDNSLPYQWNNQIMSVLQPDFEVPFNSVKGSVDKRIWAAPPRNAADSTHPNPNGQALKAAEAVTICREQLGI